MKSGEKTQMQIKGYMLRKNTAELAVGNGVNAEKTTHKGDLGGGGSSAGGVTADKNTTLQGKDRGGFGCTSVGGTNTTKTTTLRRDGGTGGATGNTTTQDGSRGGLGCAGASKGASITKTTPRRGGGGDASDTDAGKTSTQSGDRGGGGGVAAGNQPYIMDAATLKNAVSEAMAAGLITIQTEMKKELSEFRDCLRGDLKKQMEEFKAEINKKMHDSTARVDVAEKRMEDIEESFVLMEKWDIGVKDTLIQLLSDQRALEDKLTSIEQQARRNNIRCYSLAEGVEKDSPVKFMENLIKTELGLTDLVQNQNPGIERAYRVGPKPPEGAPPRSMIVRFLQLAVKEEVLHTAWAKKPCVQGKRVYFDHDYADAVQKKRQEYVPIKKALSAKKIPFKTPMTKMRVEFEKGTYTTYNSAAEAVKDLRSRGYTVENFTPKNKKKKGITEKRLAELLPWETTGPQYPGAKEKFQQQMQKKQSERSSMETEDTDLPEA
ncbi:hypothetical protein NFI96_002648 [Xyrichtys novacula]|uniref:L1 transposable element RRM domain-containing protein n=1 Tax=Xyrichtys novacula TaxID=13765 RepID=A0AAV1EXP5_XYRNO|nr:hypothetical protein NFI96_002648 [Xyrichtys novacula]